MVDKNGTGSSEEKWFSVLFTFDNSGGPFTPVACSCTVYCIFLWQHHNATPVETGSCKHYKHLQFIKFVSFCLLDKLTW